MVSASDGKLRLRLTFQDAGGSLPLLGVDEESLSCIRRADNFSPISSFLEKIDHESVDRRFVREGILEGWGGGKDYDMKSGIEKG